MAADKNLHIVLPHTCAQIGKKFIEYSTDETTHTHDTWTEGKIPGSVGVRWGGRYQREERSQGKRISKLATHYPLPRPAAWWGSGVVGAAVAKREERRREGGEHDGGEEKGGRREGREKRREGEEKGGRREKKEMRREEE
ncbi:hypothetical protein Pcinc_035070 [Petrolisthes cinctipes]|uniref:Uncharacterized protein n=1 Tax=Petrolisthes cinctipes TaxID=88211 RepID=A0AAE1BZ24_PETCI|nr:hypothetical protein Pcinc_035070 [Petrolisthes cinctipes]